MRETKRQKDIRILRMVGKINQTGKIIPYYPSKYDKDRWWELTQMGYIGYHGALTPKGLSHLYELKNSYFTIFKKILLSSTLVTILSTIILKILEKFCWI